MFPLWDTEQTCIASTPRPNCPPTRPQGASPLTPRPQPGPAPSTAPMRARPSSRSPCEESEVYSGMSFRVTE